MSMKVDGPPRVFRHPKESPEIKRTKDFVKIYSHGIITSLPNGNVLEREIFIVRSGRGTNATKNRRKHSSEQACPSCNLQRWNPADKYTRSPRKGEKACARVKSKIN